MFVKRLQRTAFVVGVGLASDWQNNSAFLPETVTFTEGEPINCGPSCNIIDDGYQLIREQWLTINNRLRNYGKQDMNIYNIRSISKHLEKRLFENMVILQHWKLICITYLRIFISIIYNKIWNMIVHRNLLLYKLFHFINMITFEWAVMHVFVVSISFSN